MDHKNKTFHAGSKIKRIAGRILSEVLKTSTERYHHNHLIKWRAKRW